MRNSNIFLTTLSCLTIAITAMENDKTQKQGTQFNKNWLTILKKVDAKHSQLKELHQEQNKLRKLLNDDFMKNAKINDLVSYLYYPSIIISSHAELEIEGDCWSKVNNRYYDKVSSLDAKARMARRGKRKIFLPFFRYALSVTPKQLQRLRTNIDNECSGHCAFSALVKLSKHCDFNVPFFFKLSPMLSGMYLYCAKKMSSSRIQKIEYSGNESYIKDLVVLAPGLAVELTPMVFVILLTFLVYKINTIEIK